MNNTYNKWNDIFLRASKQTNTQNIWISFTYQSRLLSTYSKRARKEELWVCMWIVNSPICVINGISVARRVHHSQTHLHSSLLNLHRWHINLHGFFNVFCVEQRHTCKSLSCYYQLKLLTSGNAIPVGPQHLMKVMKRLAMLITRARLVHRSLDKL